MEELLVASFLAMFAFAAFEIYLSYRWNARYFTHGLAVFAREIRLRAAEAVLPDISYLEARHSKGRLAQVLEFRRLDENTIAFKEKLLHLSLLHYTPLMRGVIRIDASRRRVTVHGYLKWYILLFTIIWLSFSVYSDDAAFALLVIIIELVLYAIQAARYMRLAGTLESFYKVDNQGISRTPG